MLALYSFLAGLLFALAMIAVAAFLIPKWAINYILINKRIWHLVIGLSFISLLMATIVIVCMHKTQKISDTMETDNESIPAGPVSPLSPSLEESQLTNPPMETPDQKAAREGLFQRSPTRLSMDDQDLVRASHIDLATEQKEWRTFAAGGHMVIAHCAIILDTSPTPGTHGIAIRIVPAGDYTTEYKGAIYDGTEWATALGDGNQHLAILQLVHTDNGTFFAPNICAMDSWTMKPSDH